MDEKWTTYYVKAFGCDDHTKVLIDLTDAEAASARKVAEAITAASESSCMPRLAMREATEADIADLGGDPQCSS